MLNESPNQVGLAEELISDRDLTVGVWTFSPSPDLEVRWTFSYSQDRRESYYGGTTILGAPGDPGWTPDLGYGDTFNGIGFTALSFRKEIGDAHTLGVNVQYQNEQLRDEQLSLGRTIRDRYESSGIGIEDEWEITEGLFFETSFFYTHLEDIFFNQPTDDPTTPEILELTKLNGGSADIYGGEINLTWLFSPFTFEVGYVEQRNRFNDTQLILGPETPDPTVPQDNQIFSKNFMRAPDRYGAFKMTWEGPWVDTFLGGTFTGRMDAPHVVNDTNGNLVRNDLNRTDWFLTLDLGISKTFPLGSRGKTTWTLGLKNITNAYQDDLDRGPYRDSAYVYGPRFPRTVFLSTNWTF